MARRKLTGPPKLGPVKVTRDSLKATIDAEQGRTGRVAITLRMAPWTLVYHLRKHGLNEYPREVRIARNRLFMVNPGPPPPILVGRNGRQRERS